MISRFPFNRLFNCHVVPAKLALALAILTTSAQAANLVVNGGFEEISMDQSSGFGPSNPFQTVAGWSTTNIFSFVFKPGTADTTGSVFPAFKLWGPANGSDNGLTPTSPAGGNFVALDADPVFTGPLTQTINGLTPGQEATLSFSWATAQIFLFNGPTTEQVQVKLGDQEFLTEVLSTPNHGFQPWRQVSFTFTPTNTSEVLSFLAIGTPSGLPPFVLLDGVSLTQEVPGEVPEPASLALLGAGLAGIGFARLRRKTAKPATADKA